MSAPLPWFRLYHRTLDDTKLKLLAFEDRWHFVALLCLKSNGLTDKPACELRDRQVAIALGVQFAELAEITRRLRDVGLIDDQLRPIAWDDLQFKSDNSTARVQAFRDRKRVGNKVQRFRNVSETAQETETETETEKIEPNGSCPSDDGLKVEHVVAAWNDDIAPALGKPKVRKLTPTRRQVVKARIAGFTVDEFREAIGNVRASPFLRGDTGWHGFSFDWFTKSANFVKILEGNYNG